MPSVFLCYRSGDDAYAATLLDEKLSQIFGAPAIFRASRSILPGEDYPSAIEQALSECQTVLVIIGPTWLERLRDGIASDQDWVQKEVATALGRGSRVIPVLLSRTPRLERQDLPPELADLANRQYVTFDHRNVARDIDHLAATLCQWLCKAPVEDDGQGDRPSRPHRAGGLASPRRRSSKRAHEPQKPGSERHQTPPQ